MDLMDLMDFSWVNNWIIYKKFKKKFTLVSMLRTKTHFGLSNSANGIKHPLCISSKQRKTWICRWSIANGCVEKHTESHLSQVTHHIHTHVFAHTRTHVFTHTHTHIPTYIQAPIDTHQAHTHLQWHMHSHCANIALAHIHMDKWMPSHRRCNTRVFLSIFESKYVVHMMHHIKSVRDISRWDLSLPAFEFSSIYLPQDWPGPLIFYFYLSKGLVLQRPSLKK